MCGATARQTTARSALDSRTVMRRAPRRRSMNGPMTGDSTAKGAIVRSRYRATLERACPVEAEKKSVPDSAIATSASPAADVA